MSQPDVALVFVACSPREGMVAITGPDVTVVAATLETDPQHMVAMLTRVLDTPRFQQAELVVAIETKGCLDHEHINRALVKAFPNRVSVMRERPLKAGVVTNRTVKKDMADMAQRAFSQNQVQLSADFFTGDDQLADTLDGLDVPCQMAIYWRERYLVA
jgi:hypothetical protein